MKYYFIDYPWHTFIELHKEQIQGKYIPDVIIFKLTNLVINMKVKQNNIIIKKVVQEIQNIDIAWYLVLEVKDFLKYLNYYKVKNVLKNIDIFCDYLHFIDHHNTTQIQQLEHDLSKKSIKSGHDLFYYVSQKWLSKIWEDKLHQRLHENDYNISYIMQWVKWLLLLTVDEFCNASPTRMSINKMLWKKEAPNLISSW